MNRRRITALGWMLASVVFAVHADAATYYVRVSGRDSNAGTTPTAAFRTIGRALTAAQAGDVIYVGGGTYVGSVTTVRAGTAAARIRLIGDRAGVYTGDAGTPVIQASGSVGVTFSHAQVDFEWFTIQGGVNNVVSSVTGSAVRGSTLVGASGDAVRTTGGTLALIGCVVSGHGGDAAEALGQGRVTLTSCTISSGTAGVNVSAAGARATVARCTIRDLTGLGVVSAGVLSLTNTMLYDVDGGGVRITGGSATLWNNTLHEAGPTGIDLRGGTLTLRNTIISASGTGFSVTSGTPTHGNNLYHGNTTNYHGVAGAVTDLTNDPAFVNPQSDWRLASGSPAINTGANGSNITTVDLQGVRRPAGSAYDLGAFESPAATATIPYTTTFENSNSAGAVWSVTTTRTSTALTRYSGRHGNADVTLALTTTPGTAYTVVFDAYMLDTWDGDNTQWGPDYFGVRADGLPIMRTTFTHPTSNTSTWGWPDMPERWGTNLDGTNNTDAVFRRVVLDFTATRGMTCLTFFAENLQGGSDEGWGIDNVRVVPRASSAEFRPAYVELGRLRGFTRTVSSGEGAGLFVADLNLDGTPDILAGGGATSTRLMGVGAFYRPESVENIRRQGGMGDGDGDGIPDFWGIATNNAARRYRGTAAGVLGPDVGAYPAIVNPEAATVADLDGNGILDAAYFAASGNFALLGSPGAGGAVSWSETTSVFPGGTSNSGNGDFCSTGDFNNDGYVDFFYHYAGGRLFLSNADGTYTATSGGIAVVTGESAKMGSAAADFDNDGDLDLLVTRRGGAGVSLWVNRGSVPGASPSTIGMFSNEAAARGIAPTIGTIGPAWGDYDNDGDLDLYMTAASGQAMLYVNSGAPNYTFTANALQGVSLETRGGDAVFFDADWDGWLDLAVSSENSSFPTRLFLRDPNTLGNTTPALLVRVEGYGAGGINTLGVGARVELWNATNTALLQRRDLGVAKGYGGQEPLVVHFGGVDPDTAYNVRVASGRRTFTTRVVPSQASTTIGSRTIPRLLTAKEPPPIRVVRWRPVSADE